MQTGTFMMIEVCEEYRQCGVVTSYARQSDNIVAIICWQFLIGWIAIAGSACSVENT